MSFETGQNKCCNANRFVVYYTRCNGGSGGLLSRRAKYGSQLHRDLTALFGAGSCTRTTRQKTVGVLNHRFCRVFLLPLGGPAGRRAGGGDGQNNLTGILCLTF
jgi:hypothetical protein